MPVNVTVISEIARKLDTIKRGVNNDHIEMATDSLDILAREFLPRGGGFDCGSAVDVDESRPNRIVIKTQFHHMDDNGYYCGWTKHDVIITPSLAYGYDIRVTGRNKRDIKGYIADTFVTALDRYIAVSFDTETKEWHYQAAA